ncbi:MAG: diaminopimelate epimerase [Dehalococcoidia bacterium]|nr:diaminopimelate epimerase [Dehalococcoidia bacterium]
MKFVKMHGTGNDFILIDARVREYDWPRLAMTMCDRHFGVGADGIVLILPPQEAGHFRMRIFNPDGSEAEMCGNGIRCFARYVLEEGLLPEPPDELMVETQAGLRSLKVYRQKGVPAMVTVGMGQPIFTPKQIPVQLPEGPVDAKVVGYPTLVDGLQLNISCVSMGNPHAVCFLDTPVDDFDLFRIGPIVENLAIFPRRINFEIVNVLDRSRMAIRIWERGAGPTLACGTGACAAMVVARDHSLVDDTVDITLPGGQLTVSWDGAGEVYMTGAAERVFTGVWGE